MSNKQKIVLHNSSFQFVQRVTLDESKYLAQRLLIIMLKMMRLVNFDKIIIIFIILIMVIVNIVNCDSWCPKPRTISMLKYCDGDDFDNDCENKLL